MVDFILWCHAVSLLCLNSDLVLFFIYFVEPVFRVRDFPPEFLANVQRIRELGALRWPVVSHSQVRQTRKFSYVFFFLLSVLLQRLLFTKFLSS